MKIHLAALLGGAAIASMGLIALSGPEPHSPAGPRVVLEPVTAVASLHDMATTTTTTTTAPASFRPTVIATPPPPPSH